MTAPDKVVYRSTHPDVLAHIEKHNRDWADWQRRVETTIVELGFAPGRNLWMNGSTVVGVELGRGEQIPDGWRLDPDGRGKAITPARRVKLGKAIARKLDAIRQPDVRNGLPGGMPKQASARSGLSTLDCGFKKLGDVVFVTWSRDMSERASDRIDPQVWERIKLSLYYAAIEAAEGGVE